MFATITLDLEYKIFIAHIAFLNFTLFTNVDIHPSHRPQIASLIVKKAPIKVFNKYADFADVFSLDLAFKFPKHIKINNYAIELVND